MATSILELFRCIQAVESVDPKANMGSNSLFSLYTLLKVAAVSTTGKVWVCSCPRNRSEVQKPLTMGTGLGEISEEK